MRYLAIPDDVENNSQAIEILRAWVLPNDEISFVTTAFPVHDSAALGIFYADLARHYFSVAGVAVEEWPDRLRRVAAGLTAEADAQELGIGIPGAIHSRNADIPHD